MISDVTSEPRVTHPSLPLDALFILCILFSHLTLDYFVMHLPLEQL